MVVEIVFFFVINKVTLKEKHWLEASGFEPETFRMRNGRSTTELCPLNGPSPIKACSISGVDSGLFIKLIQPMRQR